MNKGSAAKPKQAKQRKYMLVRYGRTNILGWFAHSEYHIPRLPARVVIKTERGLELGELVGQLCPYKAGQFKMSQEQINNYFEVSEIDYSCDVNY